MTTATLAVEYHDPATLLVNANIRNARPDQALVDSIKDLGVLQPIVAVRTTDGPLRVRFGNRRTLASIKAGLTEVPVIVAGDEATDDAAKIARILGQMAENRHREGLNAADEAKAVAALFDLDLSAADIARRTGLDKAAVAAAKAVKDSRTASRAAAANPDLTIVQAAAIAEFDGDQETVKELTEAARKGEGTFAHALQRAREKRKERAAILAATEKLTKAGVRIVDRYLGWEHQLDRYADPKLGQFNAENHKDCPGHCAYVAARWGGNVDISYYCDDPKGNGHKQHRQGSTAGMSDAEREKQLQAGRRTRAGNKEWRAATDVRRAWLRDFAARKDVPKDGMRIVMTALAHGDMCLTRAIGESHQVAREVLGLPKPESTYGPKRVAEVVDLMGKAGDARAQMIGLVLVLGGYEAAAGDHVWRNPDSYKDTVGWYFAALARWGYTLCPIEQSIVDGTDWVWEPVQQ